MIDKLKTQLRDAQGDSVQAISVFCDVRDFSRFSQSRDSAEIAYFIRRLYLQLLEKYFPTPDFVKSTGDGLLLVFHYSDKTLLGRSQEVLNGCIKCVDEFNGICKDDLMINFDVPTHVGFGIVRGPICRLHSEADTLDYSGHLLNLAARLTDLARPCGIVVDSSYDIRVIPESLRERFKQEAVYIRSVAEEKSRNVFVLSGAVMVPQQNRFPLIDHSWKYQEHSYYVKEVQQVNGTFTFMLRSKAQSVDKAHVKCSYKNPRVESIESFFGCTVTAYRERARGRNELVIDMEKVKRKLGELALPAETKLTFNIEYVPKFPSRTTASK